jgi:hypothetical protein
MNYSNNLLDDTFSFIFVSMIYIKAEFFCWSLDKNFQVSE